MSSTVLPLGPGTFTHNTSGIPIIVACTKADLIDEDADLVAGASGMGGMVKGKGGEWEERTDGIMQVLRTICLKCKSRSTRCCVTQYAQILYQTEPLCSIPPRYLRPYRSFGNMLSTSFSPHLPRLPSLRQQKLLPLPAIPSPSTKGLTL
jgi:hypothetical protein